MIKRAFSAWSVNQRRAVLIGVHIRRGDYLVAMNRIGLREPPLDYYRAVSRLVTHLCGADLKACSLPTITIHFLTLQTHQNL